MSLRDVNIMINKWIFKLKLHTDDFLNKFKTQIVVRDFSQIYNVNYENMFALTVKFNTLQIFLVLITFKNLKCHQINITNIFTKSFLKKIIYMTTLLSVKVTSNCILCILHSLYSLKQAVKNWHEHCVSELIK